MNDLDAAEALSSAPNSAHFQPDLHWNLHRGSFNSPRRMCAQAGTCAIFSLSEIVLSVRHHRRRVCLSLSGRPSIELLSRVIGTCRRLGRLTDCRHPLHASGIYSSFFASALRPNHRKLKTQENITPRYSTKSCHIKTSGWCHWRRE